MFGFVFQRRRSAFVPARSSLPPIFAHQVRLGSVHRLDPAPALVFSLVLFLVSVLTAGGQALAFAARAVRILLLQVLFPALVLPPVCAQVAHTGARSESRVCLLLGRLQQLANSR
jgi:hypothetical protein